VDQATKSARLQRLFGLSESIISTHLAAMVGSTQQVLVEGPSKSRPENMTGRSERNEIVHITGASELDLVGRMVDVEIVEAYKHSLLGELTPEARVEAQPKDGARRRLPLMDGTC